jgi:hypothetical protein
MTENTENMSKNDWKCQKLTENAKMTENVEKMTENAKKWLKMRNLFDLLDAVWVAVDFSR